MPTKLLGADQSHPSTRWICIGLLGEKKKVIPFAVVELFGLGGLLAGLLVLSLCDFILGLSLVKEKMLYLSLALWSKPVNLIFVSRIVLI